MPATMEYKTLNLNNAQLNLSSILITEESIEQFINSAIDSGSDETIQKTRQELSNSGKDNIQTRILIKKACKLSISNLESLFKKADKEKANKELLKSIKHKLLISVSILDRLQLDWQKHDLNIKF